MKGLGVRLGRALRARDYFNVRIRSPRPDDTWDEALFFFETALVSLNGALDAAARFCHLAYNLSGTPKRASWSHQKWRNQLIDVAPELKSLLDPTSGPLVPCRTLVSELRNYMTMDYVPGALAVPPNDGRRLQAAAEGLGAWVSNRLVRDA